VPRITIQGREVGSGCPAYVVAELSANHLGDFDRAVRLIEAAADASADAVKLQTFTADTITIPSDLGPFRIEGGLAWDGRTLHDLYVEASMPWDWQPRLKAVADQRGIALFSSPFDATAVEFLEAMDVPAFKIASPEVVDIGLIRRAARTGKPLLISTGMAELWEIREAVAAARDAGASEIALLKCTSSYPAEAADLNLATIEDMAATFGVPVGFSDHTVGLAAPVAAVSVGASVIEKHLTLSRDDGGPDAGFSAEPDEFRAMVDAIRLAEEAVGEVRYGPTEREIPLRQFRRSLFVVADMAEGEPFTPETVRSIRPGHGLHTRFLDDVLGRRARRPIARGTPLASDLVDPPLDDAAESP
jgi:N-acetylneuraminate synthase